jgi:hypothetical protein
MSRLIELTYLLLETASKDTSDPFLHVPGGMQIRRQSVTKGHELFPARHGYPKFSTFPDRLLAIPIANRGITLDALLVAKLR